MVSWSIRNEKRQEKLQGMQAERKSIKSQKMSPTPEKSEYKIMPVGEQNQRLGGNHQTISEHKTELHELSGPRIGFSYMPDSMIEKVKKDSSQQVELSNVMTQIGWQLEKKLVTTENGLSFLLDIVPLIGGLDQNIFIPSLTTVMGVRTTKGYEFHVGPNFTPSGTTFAYVVGMSFTYGAVNVPVNLAVFPTKYGNRYSFVTGANW